MRKPSSRWIFSTFAVLGVAACSIAACGDDDVANGGGSSSGIALADSGNDGTSSSSGDVADSSSGGAADDAPNDTGTSSGDSGDSSRDAGDDSGHDSGQDAGGDADSDADASKDASPDADAATCSSGGSGGTCDIQDGTYTLHFTSGAGTPACPLAPDQQVEINHCQGANEDAGAGCDITYDFVACKQRLHCVQSAGGFTTSVDNVTTWTSTQITGTSHSVTTGAPVAVDCTYQYTLTKNP